MNAYKCDICGALHTKTNALILENVILKRGMYSMENNYNIRPKDLCDDCYNAIAKVLNERRALNNANKENN